MTLKYQVKLHWITHALREINHILVDIFYDNKNGDHNEKTFSLGRSSFIAWFWITCYGVVVAIRTDNVVVIAGLPLWWALVGLSLLGYVIGKQYIITKLSLFSSNTTDIEIHDDDRDHLGPNDDDQNN